jgi:hypothetical protein
MQTLRLKVNDDVYDKLLWFLRKFTRDEIEIISENEEFVRNQKYLAGELDEIVTGKAKFLELNEAEERLDKAIKSNENPF